MINYIENKYIFDLIESEQLSQIKYDSIEKDNFGYTFNFCFRGYDHNLCLEESIKVFNDLLKMIKKENISLNDKRLTFKVKHENDSSYGQIELCNFRYNQEFVFDNITSVTVSNCATDIYCLNNIKNDVEYLKLLDLYNVDFPEFEKFNALKELSIINCTYSDGSKALSETEFTTLKKALPDLCIYNNL